ncbi:hypothetical protein CZ774_01495 [Frigoribacterium sp. JB110]|nr:hypothetical protein CZ774_01495 [Frigoribacterium sp. JB110]
MVTVHRKIRTGTSAAWMNSRLVRKDDERIRIRSGGVIRMES